MSAHEASWRRFVSALGRPIVVLLLLQLMGGIMLSPHRTFFPIYANELGYSALLISTLAAVRQVTGLTASLIGGSLSDLLGRKWTLLFGQVGFLLGSIVFLTPSPKWIAILWACSGFGMGLHTLGGQSYLMDAARPDYLGVLAAFFNWGYTLGGTLSSPAAGFLLDRWDYGVFGTTWAAFALLTISVNLFALPRSSARMRQKVALWKRLFGYSDIATRPPIVVLALLRFLPTLYWGMATILIPLLLDNVGAAKTTIALYATISQVSASLAQVFVGRAADRFGVKWPTIFTFSALVVSVLGTGVLPDQLSSIFAFGTLSTAAAWSLSTLLPSLAAQVTETQERGRVLGWVHLWWNAAMMAGSMIGGALFERWMGLPFLVAGALNLASIALTFVFFQMAA